VGQNPLQVSYDHPGSSDNWLEQFSGLPSHRVAPSAPFSEDLRRLTGILRLVDAFNTQPHLVGHVRHALFQGCRIPLLGFLLCPVRPVLEPNLQFPLQQVSLPRVVTALGLLDPVARLHHILDDVGMIVLHPSVSEVIPDAPHVGDAKVDGTG
jgi:hypothetical protein